MSAADKEAEEKRLAQAVAMRRDATQEYKLAIRRAKEVGLSNVKIASIAGVSETAIRMYRKRHGL